VTAPADPHLHDAADVPPPVLREVAPSVWVWLQPDGSWGLNNPAFFVGADAVVAVDTCFTERRTRGFLDAVASVTDRPVRTLVNTHHHGDHTHGNWLLPAATVIGHERCREEVLATGTAAELLFPGVEWGEIRVRPPFVTFEDRLTVWVDDLRVELVHVGPAHTTNDVVAWVPDHRLLLAGDLVFSGGTPFVVMGSVAGSLAALDRVRALDPAVVVPGHGPVGGPELLDDQEAYLRWVQEVAADADRAGLGPLDAARAADLGPFAAWHDPERLVGNLHRAASERRGEPLGTPLGLEPLFEMVELNGGRPLRCLA
jgi:cyclase